MSYSPATTPSRLFEGRQHERSIRLNATGRLASQQSGFFGEYRTMPCVTFVKRMRLEHHFAANGDHIRTVRATTAERSTTNDDKAITTRARIFIDSNEIVRLRINECAKRERSIA